MRTAVLLLMIGLVPAGSLAPRDATPVIDRVEEDWELVIRSTDVTAAGPQITTTMCPGPIEDHPDVNFNLNYRDRPTFQPGGLQIQVFDGTQFLALVTSKTESLATDGETITWTQRLSVSGGMVNYSIETGQSTTWGSFGGDSLKVSFATALSDLSAYKPEVSLNKSGVGWQSDHVTSMQLMRVRYYAGATLVSTDNTARPVP